MIGGECPDPAIEKLLGAYVLGRLDRVEAEAARGHLAGCPACRESVASLRTVAIALRLLQPADLADLVASDVADLAGRDPADLVGRDAAAGPDDPAAPARPVPATVAPTRCRFDLVLGAREQRRPRPLPSTRRG
ncbi:zf-HC2 domain-containing protein [Solwaraspora sp. WMMD791]|uniref:anti-sigma factor family protein n=1 Tax=Solwaraspora sp. WMMD791 TaxID=3016086 RepID=UPI00249AE209|nr:zf-HC2 domain-containing protein [Solwaraspora sp. WMMD791]WFE25463.1 zf-HC2 domain-containing protein [Solwaraspora sp. WMMD791]